jgi:hypothetical protein
MKKMTIERISFHVDLFAIMEKEPIRFDRLGRPIMKTESGVPPLTRWMSKIEKDTSTDCWIWQATKYPNGYGQFKTGEGRKSTSPHRFIFEYLHGKIPTDKEIHHTCNRRDCANPLHLMLVSHAENMLFARREFCKHGHRLDEKNVYTNPKTGSRHCRKCSYAASRKRETERRRTDAEYRKRRNRQKRESVARRRGH